MNRHHPYGDSPMGRRGGSPPGPGPERSHRFSDYRGGPPGRGRGYGRGRGSGSGPGGGGGYGSYDNMNYAAYDQPPPQGDMGYGSYGNTPQDPYYQSNYDAGPSAPYPATPTAGYNQGYPKYEDAPGAFEDDAYGRGRRPPPPRKERDDKVHDSIIEERIQRERPCRTLFIRNIKYETNSNDVRRSFEEHGDIKTFFDLISTRGMVFVSYYDLRAAERARERLQGSEISGRPIDVHYSLPRDDNAKDAKNNEMQGCLQVTLRSSPSGQPIDDNEVRRKFQQFGDVKSVRPVGERIDSRYVEFYDTRACDEAYDRLRHQGLQDGVMDIVFAWDASSDGPHGGGGR
ncbi:RNA-binding domain-containing protein [Armillaria solidipes]|uniref:RNA-binding domain-containing protein n=1 Tax=Armillaria solidipes TaxID=1076256 RepID=A0A2H3C0H0_9AGAR|nr:RNA-binding domain-containing protein [Armillaria solidipes]